MPDYTSKLNLKKPLGNEYAEIEDINQNMQAIDDALGSPSGIAELDETGSVPVEQLGNAPSAPVQSVNSKTGAVVLGKADVELGNVSNDAQLKIASNLSDLDNMEEARSNLGVLPVRINNGVFEYLDGGMWKAVSIITKQMKTANYLNSGNSVSGTWYTVLDVSSAKGVLSRAIAYLDSYNSGNLFLRITLDGVATVVSGLAGSFLVRGAIPIDTTTQTRSIEVITPVYFNNSLKVEIMQNTGATITLQGAVDYSLV